MRAIVSVDSAAFGKLDCKGLGQQGYDARTRALYEKNKEVLERLGRRWDYPSDENIRRHNAMNRLRQENAHILDRLTPQPDPDDLPVPSGEFCKVPLLVFTTGRGHIRPTDEAVRQLRKRLPARDAKLVAVVDSGHWIHRELPEFFNAELLEFLVNL